MHLRVWVLSAAVAVTISTATLAQSPFSNDALVRLQDNSQARPSGQLPSVTAQGSISGSVRNLDDRPVTNAKIEIRDVTTGSAVAYGYTGPSGSFEVNNLAAGTYEVVATAGLTEAREQVRADNSPVQFTLRLPQGGGNATFGPGQQTVSVRQLRIPEKAQAALKKAQNAADKGKLDEARQQIAKALAIEPKYSEAMAFLGVVNLRAGDVNSAADDFQKAIQLDNNNAMAYVAIGSLYNVKSQFDDALRELDRGVALNPHLWQAHYEISKAELGKGDYSAALKEVEKAQGLLGQHEFAPMHFVRALALFGAKSYSGAVDEFRKYLSEDKDSPVAAQVRQKIEIAKSFADAK